MYRYSYYDIDYNIDNNTIHVPVVMWNVATGNGFFVEIGGQNGVTFSNTLQFEYSMGWKGILIDASPVNYDRMRRQRPCTHNYWTASK